MLSMSTRVASSSLADGVTARMDSKASASTSSEYGDQYALYLVERICCEAEEADASHRLEAAYLACLRDNLCEEAEPLGKERLPGSPSLPRSSTIRTTTPTSVALMDASLLMSTITVSDDCDGRSKRSKRTQQDDEETPELNVWARAAAEQAASSAKRARREFWSSAGVDVEGLRSLSLR